jgi:nitrate/nitrite transporter NarK
MILAARWFPQGKQAFVIGTIITIGLLGGVVAQAPFALLTEALGWRMSSPQQRQRSR